MVDLIARHGPEFARHVEPLVFEVRIGSTTVRVGDIDFIQVADEEN